MTFFNPKEEVLDIQLTQYGKNLLSKGKMKPVYYAFFDEGVVYDPQHANSPEEKNSAETRIQDETPSIKTQYCFTGRDEFIFDGLDVDRDKQEVALYERMTTLAEDLGTSKLGSTKAPYFSLNFLEGEIKSSVDHMTGSVRANRIPIGNDTFYTQQLLKIPQLDVDVKYKISTVDPAKPNLTFKRDPFLSSDIYKNDLMIAIGPDDLMILVEEGNTTCDFENFDIEVFEMTGLTGSLDEEVLRPLYFTPQVTNIKDNILLDRTEVMAVPAGMNASDDSYVEYYFNIQVDGGISKPVICNSLKKFKKRGRNIYSPCGVEFDCPDTHDVIRSDIYASDADEEKC